RRDVRRDHRRDPGGELHRHRHHHGGHGQYDGDDGARALRRVRDAEGAGLRRRLRGTVDRARIGSDCACRRRARRARHLPARPRVREHDRLAHHRLRGVARDDRLAARGGARGRHDRGGDSGVAGGAASHRRRPARDRMTMAVPFGYIARNLIARRLTTALTAGGMALVVYVFATVLMLAAGLRATLVSTGQPDNVVVIRRGSVTEVQSGISRDQASVVESLPDIAVAGDGMRLVSKESVVLISLPKRSTVKPGNVTVRGVTAAGLELRPQVKLVAGRMFHPGTSEIVVGRAIATGFRGAQLDDTLRFGSREWTVVGEFDAGRTGFDSEIWGDATQMLQAFRRNGYSSIVFKLADPDRFDTVKTELDSDPRLT